VGDDVGNYSSSKCYKGAQKMLDLDDIEVQPKLTGVVLTQTKVQDVPISEGQLTPRPKKLHGEEGISGKNTPNRKKGAQKHHSVAVEEIKKMSKKTNVFEEDTDDEEAATRSQSGSGRAEASNGGDAESPIDKVGPDEDPIVLAKSTSKKAKEETNCGTN
jgi:hypothetical protein